MPKAEDNWVNKALDNAVWIVESWPAWMRRPEIRVPGSHGARAYGSQRTTMDPTQLMYQAADAYYAKIGAIQGYGGVAEGLAAVARDLGVDTGPDFRYISNRWHDPLSSSQITAPFERKELSFGDVIAYFDKGFQGQFNYGREHHLPHPYDRLDEFYGRHLGREVLSTDDLAQTENDVNEYLKKKGIRRNSKGYRTFLTDNAQKIVDKAIELSQDLAESKAREINERIVKLEELARDSHDKIARLEFDAKLRAVFLAEAGLIPDPITDRSIAAEFDMWEGSRKRILSLLDHLRAELPSMLSHDNVVETALYTIELSKVLKPFLEAVGLTSKFSARRPPAS